MNRTKPTPTAALDPTADGAPVGDPLWWLVDWRWEVNRDPEPWEPAGWWVEDWTSGMLAGPFHTEREATEAIAERDAISGKTRAELYADAGLDEGIRADILMYCADCHRRRPASALEVSGLPDRFGRSPRRCIDRRACAQAGLA